MTVIKINATYDMIKKYKLLRDRFNKYVDKNIHIKCYKKLLRETNNNNISSLFQKPKLLIAKP